MSWVSETSAALHEVATGVTLVFFAVVLLTQEALFLSVRWIWQRRKPRLRRRSLLLDLFMPIKKAKDAQANLEEVTPYWIAEHGRRWARVIRLVQIVRIIAGHHLGPLVAFVERVIKIVRG